MVKAVVVAEPGRIEIRELPMPRPGPHQVLCEQLYGSVCAATDRHLVRGDLPLPNIAYPLILGHESIGRVVELGPGVSSFRVGDLVTRTGYPELPGIRAFWGGFAEYGLATDARAMRDAGRPESEWRPHLVNQVLPGDVDPAAAPMMITWRETYSYLTRLGVAAGASLLILGSGGNGFSFAVLARLLGAGTIVMLGNTRWRDLARRAGVDLLVDYQAPDAAQQLAAATDGYDLIVDAVGKSGGLESVRALLKPEGRVGLYGIEDLGNRMAYLRQLTSEGVVVHGPGEYSEGEAHDAVVALLREQRLDAGIWFDLKAAVPMPAIAEALQSIEQRHSLKALVALR
ncbi:MAG: zinc-binding dehydrogenase [Gammaproteobacteria bacterium]